MNGIRKRRFSRDQRTTIVYGMLVFVLIVVILQLWLLSRKNVHERLARWRRCGRVAGGGSERRWLRAERRTTDGIWAGSSGRAGWGLARVYPLSHAAAAS